MNTRIVRKRRVHGVFIAGTDTGVGKTVLACALLRGLAMQGLKVVGMKPVAAGAQRHRGIWHNDDVTQLRAAGNVDAPQSWINPYCFAPPIAPHIAAHEAGVAMQMTLIARSFAQLARRADLVVVEGVGGLMVPLGRRFDAADIPLRLNLPVVLVVGLRLGCLNHAFLTLEVMQSRGLQLAGWIANRIDPDMERVAQNLQTLRKRIKAPLIGDIPYAKNASPETVIRSLDISRLYRAI